MKSRARSQPFYEKAVAVCVAFAVEGVLLTAFLLQPANRRMIHSQGGGMVVTILGHGSETGAAPAQPRSLAQNWTGAVRRPAVCLISSVTPQGDPVKLRLPRPRQT